MHRSIVLAFTMVLATACSGAATNPPTSATAPAASGAPGSGGAPEKSSLKIGVGGQGQIIYMPLTLADQLGYFKQEGLSVDIQDLKGGADALTAMIGGSTDATMGFYEHTLRTQTQGKFIEMIATCDLYPGLVMFAGKAHPDARTIKDLANLKIGITSAGSSTEEMVKFLFKKNGDGTVLYDTRTEQGTRDVFGGAWPAGGFYAPTDFVQQNPRTAQALARVAVTTLKYIQTHSPEDIAAKLPGQLFYPDGDQAAFAKVLGANLKMFSADGKMPADGPTNVLETLKAADTQTDWSKIDLSKTFTNALVEAVK